MRRVSGTPRRADRMQTCFRAKRDFLSSWQKVTRVDAPFGVGLVSIPRV
jgi:hypothetical protein